MGLLHMGSLVYQLGSSSRVATMSRLQAIRMLQAQNKTVRTSLGRDRSLSENLNGTRINGTVNFKLK